MGAEERTLKAIELTRSTLKRAIIDPGVLIQMAGLDVGPDVVEDVITEILYYLDKTKDSIDEEAEG